MEKDVQVVVLENYNGTPIEVRVLNGTVAKPKEIDSKVRVSGSIYAPWEYVSKEYEISEGINNLVVGRPILTYHLGANGGKPWIKFDEFPASAYDGAVINGELLPNPDLEPWRINTDQYFTNRDLQRIIRQNAFAFSEFAQAEALIKTLQNFSVSFETDIEKADDRQGNKTNRVDEFIKWNKGQFANELTLTLPLFKGTPKEDIHISIELERKGNEVLFGFYSIDLTAKLRGLAEKIVGGEVDKFRNLFVCIEVL